MNREFITQSKSAVVSAPAVTAGTTTTTGVDTQGADSGAIILALDSIGGADWTADVEESDVLGSGYTSVAAAEKILGDVTVDGAPMFAYMGSKQFFRVVLTAGTGTVSVSATSLLKMLAQTGPLTGP